MVKKLMFIVFALMCFSSIAFSAEGDAESEDYTTFRFCLAPGAGWPDKNVIGWNFGFPASGMPQGKIMKGLDSGFLFTTGDNVIGSQVGIVTAGNNIKGSQMGLFAVTKKSEINQNGLWLNYAGDSEGMQATILCNIASNFKGFQIGLLNFMDNGFVPFFPFFNFSVK